MFSALNKYRITAYIVLISLSAILYIEGQKHIKEQHDKERIDKQIAIIEPIIEQQLDDKSFHTLTDTVRSFVHKNSIHAIDDEFYAHWKDAPLMMEKLVTYAQNKTGAPPHLECSTRTKLAETILQSMGYDTRSIDVFKQGNKFLSHSFYEVLNPETGRWEVHDPDFDLFWRHIKTGKRASITDLIKDEFSNFEPCWKTDQCGAEFLSQRTMDHITEFETRFGLASIIDRKRNLRPLLVNTKRFDLEKAFDVKGTSLTYCEYREKNCRQDIIKY